MINNADEFVKQLIEAWNSHDLQKILYHYSDDCELMSPYINKLLGIKEGVLKGKGKIGEFWKMILGKLPELRLEMFDIAVCVNSLAIYYSLSGRKIIEIMFLNDSGKINRVYVHYTEINVKE